MKMTKIDNIIIKSSYCLMVLLFVGFLLYQPFMVMKIIALILGAFYVFFLMMHLAIGYPLFFLIMYTNDFLEKYDVFEDTSMILDRIIKGFYIICVLMLFYVGIPFLGVMLWNSSVDIELAIKTLEMILGNKLKK